MTQENVRLCLGILSSKIPTEHIAALKSKLETLPDEVGQKIVDAKYHDPIVVLLLSIFLGNWGVDRFVLGDIGMGILKLLLNWCTLGIWELVDIFVCYKKAKKLNLDKILGIIAQNPNPNPNPNQF